MHRFYCPHLNAAPGAQLVELDADESHHALKVLRLEPGEVVALIDGAGMLAQGPVERAGSRVRVRIEAIETFEPLAPVIDVATAIPKGPRADVMIEQLSQLGCDRLIPLRTARSIVDPRETKVERFARAAVESAKQCGRGFLMRVDAPTDFGPALWKQDHDLRLVAMPEGISNHLLVERIRKAKRVLILIGPEGGWTDEEIAEAKRERCEPWPLGPHIMRIETAAAAATAIIRHATLQG